MKFFLKLNRTQAYIIKHEIFCFLNQKFNLDTDNRIDFTLTYFYTLYI